MPNRFRKRWLWLLLLGLLVSAAAIYLTGLLERLTAPWDMVAAVVTVFIVILALVYKLLH